jgi:hypothetical protein
MKKTKDIVSSQRYDFDDMEIMVGDYLYQVIIPYDAPEELITNVTAAVVATSGRFKSIDYVRKEYQRYWNCPGIDKERKEFLLASNKIKEEIISVSEIFTNGVVRSSHLGLLAAEGSLLRLSASFKVALFLAKKGFVFESLTICRLILEQIAWALCIHKNEEEIIKTDASKCITGLKKIVPTSGRLYGFLCKMTHVSPEYHGEYLKEQNGTMAVIYSSKKSSYSAVFCILQLLDLYRIISEHISWDYIDNPVTCKKNSSGEIKILSDRPMKKTISDFEKNL